MAACHLTCTCWIWACLNVLMLSSLLNAEGPVEPVQPTDEPFASTLTQQSSSYTSNTTSNTVTHASTLNVRNTINVSMDSTKTDVISASSTATDSTSKQSVSLGSNQTNTLVSSPVRDMVTSTSFASVMVPPSSSTTTVSMVIALPSSSASPNITTESTSSLYSRTSLSSQSVTMSDSGSPSPSLKINSTTSSYTSSKAVGEGNRTTLSSALQSSPVVNVVSSSSMSSQSSTPSLTSYIGSNMNSTASMAITSTSSSAGLQVNSSTSITSSSGVFLPITPSPSVVSSSLPGFAVSSIISNKTMVSSFSASESLNVSSPSSSTSPGLFSSSTATSSVINRTMVSSVATFESVNASSTPSVSPFSSTIANSSSYGILVSSAVLNQTMVSSVAVSEFRNVSSSVSVSNFSTSYPGIMSSSATLTTISPSVSVNVSSATSTYHMSSSIAVLPTTPPLIAPSAPPQNVTAYNTSSTSIFVTWQPPLADTLNGILKNYEITLQKLESQLCQSSPTSSSSVRSSTFPTSVAYRSTSYMGIVPSSSVITHPTIPVEPTEPAVPLVHVYNAGLNLSLTISNLEKFTCYKVRVRAVTSLPGPWSSPLALKTDEDVPSQPLNVSVVDQNATSATIKWISPAEPNGIILGYRIRYGLNNSNSPTIDVTVDDQFYIVLDDLRPYTKYLVQVAAFTRIGSGDFVSLQLKTLEAAPSTVRNLTGTAINSAAIKISWKEPEYPNGAIVYVISRQNSGHPSREITNTEFIESGLQAATQYTFSVFAKNIKYGFKGAAKEIIVRTRPSEPTAPPMDVHALTMNSSSILVKWLPPPLSSRHGIITNYIVEYYVATDKDTVLKRSTRDNSTKLTLTSLKPFTEYYIRVKAVNIAGAGPASELVRNSTFEGAPSPPTNFTVRSINATSLLATWSHPVNLNGALIKYRLYARQTALISAKDKLVYVGDDTMFLISGLHEFVNYTIMLFAYNVKYGYASTPVVAMETTHPSAPSGPPLDVQAITLSSHAIHVDWQPPKVLDRNGMITGYIIRCQTQLQSVSNHSVGDDQRSVVFPGLQPFTRYYFTVQALNKVGSGPLSAQVDNTTFEDVPGPVVIDRVANVSSKVLQISWFAPKSPNGYLIDFSICWYRIDLPKQICQTVNAALRSFNITKLEPLSSYNISIAARTSVGYGPIVSAVYRTTEGVPSEPLDVQVSNVKSTSVYVSWKPPKHSNGILTQYKVFYRPNGSSSVHSFVEPRLSTNTTLKSMRPFTLYVIHVIAFTSQGPGPPATTMVTTDEGRPSEMQFLIAFKVFSRYVILKWGAPSHPNGYINYRVVYRRLDLSSNTTKFYPDTSTHATIGGLLPYTEYMFIISAHNLKYDLYGPASNVTAKTHSEPPSGPPLNVLLVNKTSETLTIAWDPPASPNGEIMGYEVTIFEGANNRYHETQTIHGDVRYYKVTALEPWHEYAVSIMCTSSGGRGPDSEKKTFRTLPSIPPTVAPIKPPNEDVITANEIVIKLEKASDANGKISFYQVIVLELAKNEDGAPIIPQKDPDNFKPEDLVTYFEAKLQKPKLVPYIAAQFRADDFSKYREFKVGDAKNFSVGARKRRDTSGQYYNGPLEPSTFYAMFQRAAVNKDIYRSTQWTEPVSTKESTVPASKTHEAATTNVGLVVGLCTAFFIIIVIIIVVFSYQLKNKRFPFRVMLDDEGDYSNRSLKLKKIRRSSRRRTSSRGLMGSTDSLDNLDDLNRRRQPIPTEEFAHHVRRMHIDGDIGFSEEYELVQPDDKEFTWQNTLLPVNKHKNRYANIIAYDHSRVLLTPIENVPGSDYINANYIDGYNRSGAYIASQGPLPETFDDFWRMIWEQGTATIVMLTQLEERGKRKCDQYWPDRGTETYGVIRVTASESSHMSYYILRTFILSHKQEEEEPRQVKQYHFTSWPDHGVPTHPVPLLSLVRTVYNANPPTAGPMVVHCSAGVGRTGTFITLDSTLQRIEKEQTIDVFEFVQQMRMKRNLMVQTESQYVFIHDALVEAVSCGVTEFEAKKFGMRLRELREVHPETGRTYMEKEFLRLLKDERHHSTFKAANMGINSAKNRYLNILPYEQSRVPLKMRPGEVGSDYINASYVDGYCRRNVYIATQAPLPGTFEDYWRMIWEQGSCVIVMLTREEEAGKVKCHRYWPSDGTRIFGNVLVELTEEVAYSDYVMRQFNMTHTEEKDSRVVRQYQYTDWPDIGLPESGVGIIDLIGQVEKWQQQSNNSIITVHCSGGVGRTGVYCAISILIERVKAEGVIDVFQTVQSLRLQRPAMVQTLEQYEFCYSTLQEYLDSFDLYANFH